MLIDTHCHLHFKDYNSDLDFVFKNAKKNDVSAMISVGCDLNDSKKAVCLSERYPFLFATVGVHPHSASEYDDSVDKCFREILSNQNKKIVAFGEIGLDYHYDFSPRKTQIEVFEKQLHLAKSFDLPVVIHCREAFSDVFGILKNSGVSKAVFHCFSESSNEAKLLMNNGYMLSFSGIVTYPKSYEMREAVKVLDDNFFMVETDSPFLTPQKFRGLRNEPANVKIVTERIAEVRGVSFSFLAKKTTENAIKFFDLKI